MSTILAEPKPRRLKLIVFALIVVASAWLRFAGLGYLSFWADEFPHVIAGNNLIEHGRPTLPSGNSYDRALAQTAAVGASMRLFGEGEAQARIPSAIVGTASIILLYLAVRKRFGEIVALASAAALALMPIHVAHSRSARFYVTFTLVYGVAAYFASRTLRTGSLSDGAVAAVALAAAFHLHPLAILLAAPILMDAAFLYVGSAGEERRRRGLSLAAVLGVAVFAAFVVAILPDARSWFLDLVRTPVPGIELDPGLRLNTVGRLLAQIQPFAWILLALPALVALRKAGRDGAALAAHTLLPALILSVLYRQGGEESTTAITGRYLLHLTPGLAAIGGLAASEIVNMLRRPHAVRVMAATVLGAASVFAGMSKIAPGTPHPGPVIRRPNWRAVAAAVTKSWRPGDALLSTDPLATSWYLGRCGTWLRTREQSAPYLVAGKDFYCGSELVPDLTATRRFVQEHARGWVVAHPGWERFVDPSVRSFIRAEMTPVPIADGSAFIFRWERPS